MSIENITGIFEVKMETLEVQAGTPPHIGRRSLDKQYHGALQAKGLGEMLSAFGDVDGSAGYVAIEFVSGTLQGQRGTFVLQHSGTMMRGAPQLVITVVPDSGSDELQGLSGSMTIKIEDGKHFYSFEYSLSAATTESH